MSRMARFELSSAFSSHKCVTTDRGVTMVSELEQQQHGNTAGMVAEELLAEYKYGLLESFSEVFGVQLLSEGDVVNDSTANG